jgi:hypothetical protein
MSTKRTHLLVLPIAPLRATSRPSHRSGSPKLATGVESRRPNATVETHVVDAISATRSVSSGKLFVHLFDFCFLAANDVTREKIKANRTVYPKGYVEMLERQQTQLVAGLHALYRRLTENESWNGEKLPEYDNRPRTQDILASLGLVQPPKHADSQVEEFQEHFASIGCDDTDTNDQNVVPEFSNAASSQLSTAYEYPDSVQIEAWEPSFEAELAELLEASKHDWTQEKEAAFVQSLGATQPVTVPSRPDLIPQDCMSLNFVDPLLYRPEWMQSDEIYGAGSSISPLSLPAHLQSFEFNVDPATLSTKATFARRQHTM